MLRFGMNAAKHVFSFDVGNHHRFKASLQLHSDTNDNKFREQGMMNFRINKFFLSSVSCFPPHFLTSHSCSWNYDGIRKVYSANWFSSALSVNDSQDVSHSSQSVTIVYPFQYKILQWSCCFSGSSNWLSEYSRNIWIWVPLHNLHLLEPSKIMPNMNCNNIITFVVLAAVTLWTNDCRVFWRSQQAYV